MLFDTCALLWTTLDPERLTEQEKLVAFTALQQGQAAVSSISFWEIDIKIKKKKLDIGMSLDQYLYKIHTLNGFDIIPVDELIWIENINLNWAHRDPADRTIVATAQLRGIPILTKDIIIRDFYPDQGWG